MRKLLLTCSIMLLFISIGISQNQFDNFVFGPQVEFSRSLTYKYNEGEFLDVPFFSSQNEIGFFISFNLSKRIKYHSSFEYGEFSWQGYTASLNHKFNNDSITVKDFWEASFVSKNISFSGGLEFGLIKFSNLQIVLICELSYNKILNFNLRQDYLISSIDERMFRGERSFELLEPYQSNRWTIIENYPMAKLGIGFNLKKVLLQLIAKKSDTNLVGRFTSYGMRLRYLIN